jgi:hypothetical protein
MATTKQTINSFYTKAVKKDFSRDILFRVVSITPDTALNIPTTNLLSDEDLVYAKTAKVPSRNITNQEAAYMGLKFNLPGVVEYPESGNYQIEFYCDINSTLRSKFEAWSRITFDDVNSTGNFANDGSIQLAQLNSKLELVQQYKLVGVTIRNVGEIAYTMAEGTGSVQTFPVTFAYHYYTLIGTETGGVGVDLPKKTTVV